MSTQFSAALPLAVCVSVSVALAPVRAHAQSPTASHSDLQLSTAAEPTQFVPGAIAAATGAALATGYGWAGYDGATRTPLVGAAAEVRLASRLVVGAGATYAARDSQDAAEIRPSVVARFQILDQAQRGIDLGAAIAYRQDRFVSEEGLLQGTLSLGVHGEAGSVLVNLGYGQDGEGDDHVGDARLVALRHVVGSLHVG